MNKLTFSFAAFMATLFVVLVSAPSCTDKCEQTYTYMAYEPVYLSYAELRQPLTVTTGLELKQAGKIYFKPPYLLINEPNQGIHVIDNSNPASPQNVAFIEIPGNIDMAVKNNVLYADSYTDLLAIDISDPANASLLTRTENAFTDIYPSDPNLGIVTGYNQVERTEVYDCNQYYPTPYMFDDVAVQGGVLTNEVSPSGSGTSSGDTQTSNSPSNGVGGSMARFTLANDYLYIVTPYSLQTYSISNPTQPVNTSTVNIGWNIETIFPFQNNLLIGSQTGMFIYNLVNPAQPAYVAQFAHVTSCDPVVAEGNYAYVTLRSGTACQGFSNELDVLDISTLSNPQLVKTYPMTNPHGLGIDNGTLFICDGDAGLKIYDASNVYTIDQNLLAHYDNINAFDVIPYNQILLMIGSNGLYQYDYSNLQNISLLSTIPIKP